MRIEELKTDFQIDVGAPTPVILCDEHTLFLTFYGRRIDPDWDGSSIHVRTIEDEGIITVRFLNYWQFKFGYPNDEAIDGHPYYKLGLRPYSTQELFDSDWIEDLRKMNSVHPYHKDQRFQNLRHLIFFFHDTCFEIACDGFEVENEHRPSMKEEIQRISDVIRKA